ncbi:MAG: hypothetical protein CBHOC_0426 [uncultured Caballeronia sp.]|nr:MAG: hypothetical protein CBHOC_0426 [uncultured Caballeronia sp.]
MPRQTGHDQNKRLYGPLYRHTRRALRHAVGERVRANRNARRHLADHRRSDGKPKAIIQITDDGSGQLSGKVVRGIGEFNHPERRCTACTDERKDQE